MFAHVPQTSLPTYQALFTVYNSSPGIGRAVPVANGTLPLQDSSNNLGCGKQSFTGTYVSGNTGPRFGREVPCAVAFGINTETFISGRIDYTINDRQKIYARISRDAGVQATSTSPVSPLFNQQSIQPWVIPQLNYTYAIMPRLVNNFILNGNWYSIRSGNPDYNAAVAALPTSFRFNDGGAHGSVAGSRFARVGPVFPTRRRGQQLGIIDDLSYSIAKHTLQAGVNDRNNRISDVNVAGGSVIGTYTFADLTDFANGIVNSTGKGSTYTQSFPVLNSVHTRLNSLGFYIQDEWKVQRNLNLTYGVRFELQGNPSCKENCYSRANTAFLGSGYQSGATVPYNATIQAGQGKNFKNFEGVVTEPRFAFAYSPFGEGKTVVRGGDLPEERHLWIVPITGGTIRRLTHLPGIEGSPQWTPDGQRIYFTRGTALQPPAAYLAEVSGTAEPKPLQPERASKFAELGITPEVAHFQSKNGFRNVEDSGGGEIDDIAASVKYLVDEGITDPRPSQSAAATTAAR